MHPTHDHNPGAPLPHSIPPPPAATHPVTKSSLWNPAAALPAGAVVSIAPGVTVDVDAPVSCGTLHIQKGGTLRLLPGAQLNVGTLYNFGAVEMADGAQVIITDTLLDPAADPLRYRTGVLCLGRFHARGAYRTPFVRCAEEPLKNHRALLLSSVPEGWQVGDEVLIPDTRQWRKPETEWKWNEHHYYWYRGENQFARGVYRIKAMTGEAIEVEPPLERDYRGARDPITGELLTLPHCVNLTRGAVIRSANPNGTRGHFLATAYADVDIRGVEFRDMGRTTIAPIDPDKNPIGRYTLHCHHLTGPVPVNEWRDDSRSFNVEDCVFRDCRKWGAAIHATNYGRFVGNVVYGAEGAGIVTEDGSETGNLIKGNFVCNVLGTREPYGARGRSDVAHQGYGIWLSNWCNRVEDNVCANVGNDGIVQDPIANFDGNKKENDRYVPTTAFPKFPGADHAQPDHWFQPQFPWLHRPYPDPYHRNEVYASERGMVAMGPESLSISDHDPLLWHIFDTAYFIWHNGLTGGLYRPRVYGDWDVAKQHRHVHNEDTFTYGIRSFYYYPTPLVVDADVRGCDFGIELETNSGGNEHGQQHQMLVVRPRLLNRYNLLFHADMHYVHLKPEPSRTVVYKPTFAHPPGDCADCWNIRMDAGIGIKQAPTQPILMFLLDYEGEDYQLYWDLSMPDVLVPKDGAKSWYDGVELTDMWSGVPEAGLTNQEAFNRYGKALMGRLMPPGAAVLPGLVGGRAGPIVDPPFTEAWPAPEGIEWGGTPGKPTIPPEILEEYMKTKAEKDAKQEEVARVLTEYNTVDEKFITFCENHIDAVVDYQDDHDFLDMVQDFFTQRIERKQQIMAEHEQQHADDPQPAHPNEDTELIPAGGGPGHAGGH